MVSQYGSRNWALWGKEADEQKSVYVLKRTAETIRLLLLHAATFYAMPGAPV